MSQDKSLMTKRINGDCPPGTRSENIFFFLNNVLTNIGMVYLHTFNEAWGFHCHSFYLQIKI